MKRHQHAGRLASDGLGISALSAADLDAIHHASLEVLERAGVYVEDDQALAVFADAGCRIDREKNVARIPPARRRGRAGGLSACLRVLRPGSQARLHDGVQPRRLRDVLRGHPHERHRDRREPAVRQAGRRRHHPPRGCAPGHRRRRVAGGRTRRRRGRPERPRPRGDVQQHDQARAPADDDEARGRGGGRDGARRGRRGRRSPRPSAHQRRLRHRQPVAAHQAVQRRQLRSGRAPVCRRSS